jgi:hypothetical protein
MTALIWLESNQYFQGRHNVHAYIDEFKDLVDMSGYTNPIAIILKFYGGLNVIIQDKITKSGTDRPEDNDQWLVQSHSLTRPQPPSQQDIPLHLMKSYSPVNVFLA